MCGPFCLMMSTWAEEGMSETSGAHNSCSEHLLQLSLHDLNFPLIAPCIQPVGLSIFWYLALLGNIRMLYVIERPTSFSGSWAKVKENWGGLQDLPYSPGDQTDYLWDGQSSTKLCKLETLHLILISLNFGIKVSLHLVILYHQRIWWWDHTKWSKPF